MVAISAGRAHSLALLSDGSVLSWGAAQSGQLGLGDTVEQPRPVRVWPHREETMEVEGAPAACARVVGVVAGGHSSALLLADPNAADDQLAHNAATSVSLPTIDKLTITRLSGERQWTELASLVRDDGWNAHPDHDSASPSSLYPSLCPLPLCPFPCVPFPCAPSTVSPSLVPPSLVPPWPPRARAFPLASEGPCASTSRCRSSVSSDRRQRVTLPSLMRVRECSMR